MHRPHQIAVFKYGLYQNQNPALRAGVSHCFAWYQCHVCTNCVELTSLTMAENLLLFVSRFRCIDDCLNIRYFNSTSHGAFHLTAGFDIPQYMHFNMNQMDDSCFLSIALYACAIQWDKSRYCHEN